ncbi:MAG: 1,2-phenylacetyl-CoA epoxidase subunit PaaE [Flavitalea sp.]
MTQFHSLVIKEIRKETSDCVSISFEIPRHLSKQFEFEPGQNITLKHIISGEELRRSYSICSSPLEKELRIAVKKINAGQFSTHANREFKVGDTLQVLPPSGRFSARINKSDTGNYLAFASGSGITPVISIIKTILASHHHSQFTLVFGNRNRTSIIFKEQLEAIKNRYMDRFSLHNIFSREITDADIYHGRIDALKCEQLSHYLINIIYMDHIFICGPEEMIFNTRDWLLKKGIDKNKIHFELFTVPGQKTIINSFSEIKSSEKTSAITLTLDGRAINYNLEYYGLSVLDGALREGADLPFACKGGVCATCKAKLISGEVEMDNNYALEAEELAAGFILTCQSHPRTDSVEINFDLR